MRNKYYLEAVLARDHSSQAPGSVTGPRLVKSLPFTARYLVLKNE